MPSNTFELDARADEDAREKRWEAFVAVISAQKVALHHWSDVIEEASHAFMLVEASEPLFCRTYFEQTCCEFADLEGWDGVLSAIARAMREQATNGN